MLVNLDQSPSQPVTTNALLAVFADFLNIDVGAGDAALDTLATYRRQLQQFVLWCDRVGTSPATATKEEIKKYRRFLVEENFKPATIGKPG